MDGYYITVKTNLLDEKHVKQMQPGERTCALWLYLWFLDRVTRVEDGLGIVLGGKPFKFSDFKPMGLKATRMSFRCLEKHGYIKIQRTPYGNRVWITKCYKVFGMKQKKVARDRSLPSPGIGLYVARDRSNKTRQYDKTVDKIKGFEKLFPSNIVDNFRKDNP